MKISERGKNLIVQYEGMVLKPYLCSGNVPTIGIGSTFYEDGTKVKLTDKPITKERALLLFDNIVNKFALEVGKLIKSKVNQNQFDALVSFAFNVGVGNLQNSTLLKKVNINPNDPTIKNEFMRWNKSGGRELLGLTKRRNAESILYFL